VGADPTNLKLLIKYAAAVLTYIQSRVTALASNPPPESIDEVLAYFKDPEEIYTQHVGPNNECLMMLHLLKAQLLLRVGIRGGGGGGGGGEGVRDRGVFFLWACLLSHVVLVVLVAERQGS
jgi:hypothetical protein